MGRRWNIRSLPFILARLFELCARAMMPSVSSYLPVCVTISTACRVDITPEQVQMFIDLVDANDNKTIEREEFPDLIWKMATADLSAAHHAPAASQA